MKAKVNNHLLLCYTLVMILISLTRIGILQNRGNLFDIWSFNFYIFSTRQYAFLDIILIITPFLIVHCFLGGMLEQDITSNAPLFFSRYRKRTSYLWFLFNRIQTNIALFSFIKMIVDVIVIKLCSTSIQLSFSEVGILYFQMYLNFAVMLSITYASVFFVKRTQPIIVLFHLVVLLCFVLKDSIVIGSIAKFIPIFCLMYERGFQSISLLWLFFLISLGMYVCHRQLKKLDFL